MNKIALYSLLAFFLVNIQGIYNNLQVYFWDDVCFSVTNYWPFVWVDGQWVHEPLNGQADDNPYLTATLTPTSPELQGQFVAMADGFTSSDHPFWGRRVQLSGYDAPMPVLDRFGDPTHRQGIFWHPVYKRFVLGVDIFTPEPTHYLDCGGEIR